MVLMLMLMFTNIPHAHGLGHVQLQLHVHGGVHGHVGAAYRVLDSISKSSHGSPITFTNAIRYHRDHHLDHQDQDHQDHQDRDHHLDHQDHDDQDHLVVVLVEKEFLMVAFLLVFFQGLARQKRQ